MVSLMETLQQRLQAANELLASYAIPHDGIAGRKEREHDDETRFPFQRDRGRIVHSQSFRRLKGKTQVFITGQGDHYRTRLTHTMEVALLSRDIARTFKLNEDLSECIALAHDLGHPPFGHAGEETLNEWMKKHNSFFEHNIQSHRIVTVLEEHSSLFEGLNLNQEILDGLIKHQTPHDQPDEILQHAPSLEAQIVNIADEIAYSAHDCEDGISQGLFTMKDLTDVPLAQFAHERRRGRETSLRGALIHLLVHNLYDTSEKKISEQGISEVKDVYACTESLIYFSSGMRKELDELRTFLWDNMYLHPQIVERSNKGKVIVSSLCEHYMKDPSAKIIEFEEKTDSLHEAVKDYVCGMTDEYAKKQAEDLEII